MTASDPTPRQRRKGFTLIELIVVIVIIGILATIAVVGFSALISTTRQAAVEKSAQAFDREYLAMLAYETGVDGWDDPNSVNYADLSDVADEVMAGSTGATALASVDAAADTVTFTKDGKTACIVLSTDPATPSTLTPGVCAGATTTTTVPPAALVLTIDTTLSAGTTFTLPFRYDVDVTIDWGDSGASGCVTATTSNYPVCTYAAPGTYTITVNGTYRQLGGAVNGTSQNKIISVSSWGGGVQSFAGAMYATKYLTTVPNYLPPTVTTLQGMFGAAEIFNSPNISNWNTSNVTDLDQLFYGAYAFNQPLNWDTSNVTTMWQTFIFATSFNQPLSAWDTSKVTRMMQMFMAASSFNQDIGGWKTGSVVTNGLVDMFNGATVFNQNLTSWCVTANQTLPAGFRTSSALTAPNSPVWGTCPA
jgi:prepilin-type N-terminal cleavage/methylation domain-containing protein